jgi:hypothetical protein
LNPSGYITPSPLGFFVIERLFGSGAGIASRLSSQPFTKELPNPPLPYLKPTTPVNFIIKSGRSLLQIPALRITLRLSMQEIIIFI